MKKYDITVILQVPVELEAENDEEAVELAKELCFECLDMCEVYDVLIDKVKAVKT